MPSIDKILLEIKADTKDLKNVSAELSQIKQSAESTGAKIKSSLTSAFSVLAGGAAFAKIKSFYESAIESSNKLEQSMLKISALSRQFGLDSDKMKKSIIAMGTDGVLSIDQATSSMQQLLGMGLKSDQAFKFIEASKKISAFKNITGDAGQAVGDFVKGLVTGSAELLENMDPALRKVISSLGGYTKVANDVNARQKLINYVIADGAKYTESYAEYLNSGAVAQKRFTSAVEQASAAIGDSLKPILNSVLNSVAELLVGFTEWWKSLAGGTKTVILIGTGLSALIPIISSLIPLIAGLETALLFLTGPIGIALAVVAAATVAIAAGMQHATQQEKSLAHEYERLRTNSEKLNAVEKERLNYITESIALHATENQKLELINGTYEKRERILKRIQELQVLHQSKMEKNLQAIKNLSLEELQSLTKSANALNTKNPFGESIKGQKSSLTELLAQYGIDISQTTSRDADRDISNSVSKALIREIDSKKKPNTLSTDKSPKLTDFPLDEFEKKLKQAETDYKEFITALNQASENEVKNLADYTGINYTTNAKAKIALADKASLEKLNKIDEITTDIVGSTEYEKSILAENKRHQEVLKNQELEYNAQFNYIQKHITDEKEKISLIEKLERDSNKKLFDERKNNEIELLKIQTENTNKKIDSLSTASGGIFTALKGGPQAIGGIGSAIGGTGSLIGGSIGAISTTVSAGLGLFGGIVGGISDLLGAGSEKKRQEEDKRRQEEDRAHQVRIALMQKEIELREKLIQFEQQKVDAIIQSKSLTEQAIDLSSMTESGKLAERQKIIQASRSKILGTIGSAVTIGGKSISTDQSPFAILNQLSTVTNQATSENRIKELLSYATGLGFGINGQTQSLQSFAGTISGSIDSATPADSVNRVSMFKSAVDQLSAEGNSRFAELDQVIKSIQKSREKSGVNRWNASEVSQVWDANSNNIINDLNSRYQEIIKSLSGTQDTVTSRSASNIAILKNLAGIQSEYIQNNRKLQLAKIDETLAQTDITGRELTISGASADTVQTARLADLKALSQTIASNIGVDLKNLTGAYNTIDPESKDQYKRLLDIMSQIKDINTQIESNTSSLKLIDDQKLPFLDISLRRFVSGGNAIQVNPQALSLPDSVQTSLSLTSSVASGKTYTERTAIATEKIVNLAQEQVDLLAVIAANLDNNPQTNISTNWLVNQLAEIQARRI